MLDEKKIAQYLTLFKDVSLDDLQLLFSLATEKRLKAGEHYIETGSVSNRLAYVKSGLIRAYNINEKGDDITILLRWEDQFFANFETIFWQRPTRFTYQALEDTVLLEADYHKFMKIIDANPGLSAAKTYFLQHMLAEALERVEGFVLLNPEQRYLHLLNQQNNLAQRVPAKYIASLLGITSVSLSRIKRRVTSRPSRGIAG